MDDMKSTIQGIASKGRNGDSMLVHMAPEEVQGIASLGMVSVNPDTGLPEMFKFKDFLKIAVPIAITAMAPAAGAAAASKGAAMASAGNAGFLSSAGQFLGTPIGKSLLTGAAQFAGQRLVGTDEKDALNAGIMAGATYGAASAAQKAFGPSQTDLAQRDKAFNLAQQRQADFMKQIDPANFEPKTITGSGYPMQTVSGLDAVKGSDLGKQYGIRSDMTGDELTKVRDLARADYNKAQSDYIKSRFGYQLPDQFQSQEFRDAVEAGGGKYRYDNIEDLQDKVNFISKGDIYSGLGAGAVGAMSVPPEVIEEERKRREIAMAQPYSTPATFPGAGYGSREYGYFGPNYGLYAKEGGHIKQMQEGGAVDTTTGTDIIPPSTPSAFSGDLMAFAPGIVGGANYGMGAMPGGIDSSEFNYNVAPNMGGYDYRSFVPEDARGQGIGSVGTGMGTGEKVTGNPNVLEDIKKTSFKPYTKWTPFSKLGEATNIPGASNRVFRDVISGYTGSGEPIYTRETKYKVAGTGMGHYMNPAKYVYGTRPIKFQEGGITSLPQTQGQVEGRGDGMSDEVYGDIENQQEVALSKDEFIVPADVVSGLGNGSSDAGASKLYEMMARVRKARTGKETQPEEIRAEEFMPA